MAAHLPKRPSRSAPVRVAALLVGCSLGVGGCASVNMQFGGPGSVGGPRPASEVLDPRLGLAVTAPSNSMERAAALDAAARAEQRERDGGNTKKAVTPALFWTGVVLGSLGVAGMVGGGITGGVTEEQIRDGDAAGWSRSEREEAISRGETANTITIVGVVLTAVGLGMSTVVAGIDYTRCGPVITKKRRRECETLTPEAE